MAVGGRRKISWGLSTLSDCAPCPHIETISISRPRLQIAAFISQSLASEKLSVLNFDWVVAPSIGIIVTPKLRIRRQQVRRQG